MSNKNTKILYVQCPTCKKRVRWSEKLKSRPFCSERCRLIDLGEWATDKYQIPGDEKIGKDESED